MNVGAFPSNETSSDTEGIFWGAFSTNVDVGMSSLNTLETLFFKKQFTTFESALSSDSAVAFLFQAAGHVMLCSLRQ